QPGTESVQGAINLVHTLYLNGDHSQAQSLLQENLDWSVKHFGPTHPKTDLLRGMQVRLWIDEERVEPAVGLARELVTFRRELYGPQNALTGNALLDLGCGLVLLKRYAEAETSLTECLSIFAKG